MLPLLLLILPPVLLALFLWVSRQHRIEAGASRWRQVRVCAGFALLAVTPLALPLWLGQRAGVLTPRVVALDPDGQIRELPVRPPGGILPVDPAGALLAVVLLTALLARVLRPVSSLWRRGSGLRPCDDGEVRAMVRGLAAEFGLPMPAVHAIRSLGVALDTLAATGGSLGTVVILTDGLRHRLEPEETRAVLAHELAHVAHGDVPRMRWFMVGCMHLLVLLTAWIDPLVAMLVAVATMYVGLRLRGRFAEPRCDVAAARRVGFLAMERALDKIHAVHLKLGENLLGVLARAGTTHPPLVIRRARLRRAAPAVEQPSIVVDAVALRRHRAAAVLVFGCQLLLLATALWCGTRTQVGWIAAGLALAGFAAVLPVLLMLLAQMRNLVDGLRLVGWPGVDVAWLLNATTGGVLLGVATRGRAGPSLLAALAAAWLLWGIVLLVVRRRGRRLLAQIDAAIRDREFARARELHAALPPWRQRRPQTRILHAVVLAAAGDLAAAVAELEPMRSRAARMWLGRLLRETEPERALALADALCRELPRAAFPHLHRAQALRRLGRLDEALAAARAAERLEPQEGLVQAVLALIAVELGAVADAVPHLRAAQQLAPGDALVRVAAARLALVRGDADAAARLQQARTAVAATPLAFLDAELARATAPRS